ncbi:trypsin-like peptidase domain-containing protein [Candidatus Wolfebacteria bacterium]|nr:trypsin-like peptidase domain-containing protein [Candidatus Wolfebacteria bacterium]
MLHVVFLRIAAIILLLVGIIFVGSRITHTVNPPSEITSEAAPTVPAPSSFTAPTSTPRLIATTSTEGKKPLPAKRRNPPRKAPLITLPKIEPKPSVSTTLPVAPFVPTSSTAPVIVSSRSIDTQSVVGLNCYFKNKSTGALANIAKGSGVIIDSRGYVLTSRHLVDLLFAAGIEDRFAQFADSYIFSYCAVGNAPQGATLPSRDIIQSFNPAIQLPILGYLSDIFFVPRNLPVSPEEADQLDFAILKINGVAADGPSFGIAELPRSFPFARLASADEMPTVGSEVLTYGFPGDVTVGMNSSFTTLYLTGGVGQVQEIFGGNNYFINRPLVINTRMGVSSGRSGSPLFYRGLVAGIISSYRSGNSADSFSVSSAAIAEFLPNELK